MRTHIQARFRNGTVRTIPVSGETEFQSVAYMLIKAGVIVLNAVGYTKRITHEEYMMFLHEKYVMP